MTSVTIDDRCAGLRRRLSPLAWRLLEEAALSASAGPGGALVVGLSVRSVSGLLGVGKQAAAAALRALVVEGLVVAVPSDRRPGGGFAAARYVLRLPEGVAVSGVAVSGPAVSGPAVSGGSVSATSVPGRAGVAVAPDRSAERVVGGQAQLFGEDLVEGGSVAGSESAPRGDGGRGGAASRRGCEGVIGGHELAPGVPARAGRSDRGAPC